MFYHIWFLILFLFSSLHASTPTDTAKSWLVQNVNQQFIDQNSSNLALATQVSKETLASIQLQGSISDLNENFVLIAFEDALDENTTEYLSSKIVSYAMYGKDITSLTVRLLDLQNKDGGFGHSLGHQSTVLDTTLALEALSHTASEQQKVANALTYLLSKQLSNGSWMELLDDTTNYTTALAMRALWLHRKSYDVQNYMENAKNYLTAQKSTNGSYGETFLTALILGSVAPLYYNKAELQSTIDYLKSTQQPSGSWEEDIYTTALALQSLYVADKEVPNPDLGTLSALVVDGERGVPLSGVTIELEGVKTTTTGNDGKFVFNGLQNGTYMIHILSNNHAPLHASIRMMGANIDLGTLRLNQNVNTTISTLKGIVKDAVTGMPLYGAKVTTGDKEATTDTSGNYTIDSINAGANSITISKAGYLQKQQTVNIPPNTILYYNAVLQILDLTVEASIKGMVVNKDTSLSLGGVLIEVSGAISQNVLTQGDGRFLFSKLGAGSYNIKISKEGYRTLVAMIEIDQSKIVDFGTIALETAGSSDTTVTLQGVVSEAQTKLPIEGALINVGGNTAYSDKSGYYNISNLGAGTITIEVSKDKYTTVTTQTNVLAGAILSFSPAMQKEDANISIFGTIFDSNNSKPLEYVKVEYFGESNGTVYTDENGYYLITPVKSGNITLSYNKIGYETIIFDTNISTNSINLSPKLTPILNSSLVNNASLHGVVLDMITQQPIEGVNISVKGLQTNVSIISDIDGVFSLPDITSFDLNISFSKSGFKETSSTVHLYQNEQFDMGPVSMRPISDRELYPDLTISSTDLTQVNITQDEFAVSGNINVVISNQGGVLTESGFAILAFYDVNRDGNYSDQIDLVLGETSNDTILGIDQNITALLTLKGELPYVNAPISIWIDSSTNIIESNEKNNIVALNKKCGVVSEIFTSSYQAQAVKNAIVRGSDYVAPQTMSWDRNNRCLGCHVQTQTLVGLQASMAKAEVDTITGDYLLTKILGSQQSDGSIRRSHPEYSKTQTAFALWSLSYVPDTNRTFNVRANALRFLDARKSTTSNRVYWTQDHTTGWINSSESITAIVALGASHYLKDVKNQAVLTMLEEDIANKYTELLPKITRYLLSRVSTNRDNITTALLMVGLGEARRHIIDSNLQKEVDSAIQTLDRILRERQKGNGGWSYYNGSVSDPLTSAWVGFALNYRSPLSTDQAVLRNIQYLLDSQGSNGTWVTNSGLFSTHLATTSLVMAYLPVALDFLDSADLSVSMMHLTEETDGTLSLSARIGNGGSDQLRTSTSVSFYDGDPAQNGILISEEDILSLAKWEYLDITLRDISIINNSNIYAVVDPDNWIHECNELNNYMSIPASASKLYGKITVSTDEMTYTANQIASLASESTNLGKLDAPLSSQLFVEDVSGNSIYIFSPRELGIVATGGSITKSETMNLGTLLAGSYVLRGKLYDAQGNTVDEAISNFQIVGEVLNGEQANLQVATDRFRYHTSDTVLLYNLTQSLSSNSIINNAIVELKIANSNGNIVNSQTLSLNDLLPLSTRTIDTNYTYSRLPVGQYTVQAILYGNGGSVYASDSAVFEVYEDLSQALKGSVSTAWNAQLAGAEQSCRYSVTNFGSTELTNLPLELRVMDMNRSLVMETFANTVSLSDANTINASQNFSTNGYEAGDYSCALFAKMSEEWTLLDHAPFTVEVPPIIIGGELEQIGKGRILVLLDPCDNNETNASCEEPFGSQDAVSLNVQKTYLQNLLEKNGYSYTIVTDDVNFTKELRSGTYTTYALLDETVKLSKTTQNELREAVFKGEGLFVSGTHDSRNHFIYETLGAKFVGHHSKVDSVEITGETYDYFESALLNNGSNINFDSESTTQLGSYLPKGNKGTYPSVVKYSFGKGESIFAGFDVLAEASTHPQSPYGNFLIEALSDLNQIGTMFTTGDIIPMTLEVVNEGIATPIRSDLNLSRNAKFVDATGAESMSSQSLSFSEAMLAKDETKTYSFWIQALNGGSIEMIAHIFSLLDGNEKEQTQLDYTVVVGGIQDMEELLGLAEQIELTSKQDTQRFKQALKELKQAQSDIEANKLEEALSDFLKATDELQAIEEKEVVKSLRIIIDQQIRVIEMKLNKGEM